MSGTIEPKNTPKICHFAIHLQTLTFQTNYSCQVLYQTFYLPELSYKKFYGLLKVLEIRKTTLLRRFTPILKPNFARPHLAQISSKTNHLIVSSNYSRNFLAWFLLQLPHPWQPKGSLHELNCKTSDIKIRGWERN